MMRYLILLLAVPAAADVEKCVDDLGKVTYQDLPCPVYEKSVDINRSYANELPVAPPLEEREAMDRLRQAREARQEAHVNRRNKAIQEHTRQYEERKALCRQLKEDRQALARFKRRNGRPGDDYEGKLIRQMREACSGWSGG